jgi:hypothetical protein
MRARSHLEMKHVDIDQRNLTWKHLFVTHRKTLFGPEIDGMLWHLHYASMNMSMSLISSSLAVVGTIINMASVVLCFINGHAFKTMLSIEPGWNLDSIMPQYLQTYLFHDLLLCSH